MKKVIFIAGPPGSGKTELIKKFDFNRYKVFDLDTYRSQSKEFSMDNPLNYSESTTKNAGIMMNEDINNSLLDDSTIVIETTFSSFNNTLEQIKNSNKYQIFAYLFIINDIEFFISILERFISSYINGDNCRLISFDKYLNKLKFYKEYIDIIKNYNINISYVIRDGNTIKILENYPVLNNQHDINYYTDRISKIKQFCSQTKAIQLTEELNKMLQYYKNYDKID